MHESDTTAGSIAEYLPAQDSDGRLELFVRSLAPPTDNDRQTECFERLRRLEDGDHVTVAVTVWGDGICTHAPEIAGIGDVLETITDIYSFSAESRASIASFFQVKRVDASLTGECFERIVPPQRTLLAYEGDSLVGVFPCALKDRTYTPYDAIERVESDGDQRLFQSAASKSD
jgi:hypothetical protein